MLKRDAKGLGFSIAGGKGSTPYKGNDEVNIVFHMLFVFKIQSLLVDGKRYTLIVSVYRNINAKIASFSWH